MGLPGKFSDNAFPLLANQTRTVRYTARNHKGHLVDKDALLKRLQVRSLYDTIPKGSTAASKPATATATAQKHVNGHGAVVAVEKKAVVSDEQGEEPERLFEETMVASSMRSPPTHEVGGDGQQRRLLRG